MRHHRTIASLLFGLLLFFVSCTGGSGNGDVEPFDLIQNSTLSRIQSRGTLIVGMEVEFWPFEYAGEDGEPVGFDVDLAGELADALGVELELVNTDFPSLIPSLETGKIDIAISGITATLQRARKIAFSDPYFLTGLCLLVQKDGSIQGPRDLNDPSITLALKEGTTGHTTSERLFPKAQKKFFNEEAACALQVAQGNADAFVYDKLSILKHHRQHAETTRAILEPFTYEPYAIAFRQGEPDLGRYLDHFLRTLERDGRMEALREKHFGELTGR